ncbi:MAG: endonuclease domain-containing protein [Porticoccaceae bacterium]
MLWYHLRGHRFEGAKFKRQKPTGPFIVDFVCLESRLVIELDGGQHADDVAYDQRRDAWLAANGYRVLRFWNNEVMQNLPGVLERIRELLGATDAPSPPAPLPHAGEGSKGDASVGLSGLSPQAGEGTKSTAAGVFSFLPLAGKKSKGDVAAGLSPLPFAGEGGRRPGEGTSAENKTAPEEVQSRSADRERPNPCNE